MKRLVCGIAGLASLAVASCGGEGGGGPLDELTRDLARQCGLTCPAEGVLEGNAAISGVAQVDAFFATVNTFRGRADGVSAGIEAQLDAIRGDFGIAASTDLEAGLEAQIEANIDGDIVVEYQPARCAVDATATFEAKARCEAEVMPPTVELECKGSCDIEAGAELECDASATLECDFTGPTVDCEGTCKGTCEATLTAKATCSGICRGSCDGTCSAYSDEGLTQCAGECDGMCMGTCEAEVDASASCEGTCKGTCTVSGPEAECEGSARARCKANANASIMCKGKCEGDFEPPSASAECEASARAEAKLNVQCTPPELAINYKLKADVDATAQARFVAALKTLVRVRMPALLAASARAKSVASAGEDLRLAATAAVETSVEGALEGDLSPKSQIGLACALGELEDVSDALSDSAERLNLSLTDAATVSAVLKI